MRLSSGTNFNGRAVVFLVDSFQCIASFLAVFIDAKILV